MAGMKGYVFQGRNNAHIETRQIQRLLGTVTKGGASGDEAGDDELLSPGDPDL